MRLVLMKMMMKGDDADEKEEEGLEMIAAWDVIGVALWCLQGEDDGDHKKEMVMGEDDGGWRDEGAEAFRRRDADGMMREDKDGDKVDDDVE